MYYIFTQVVTIVYIHVKIAITHGTQLLTSLCNSPWTVNGYLDIHFPRDDSTNILASYCNPTNATE